MPKFKVTYNAKPKRTEEMECNSFQQLIKKIYLVFNIEEGKINFMRPRPKVSDYSSQDEESFKKDVKDGIEILIVGALRKEKTKEQIEKEKQLEARLARERQELSMNAHERILKKLVENNIK